MGELLPLELKQADFKKPQGQVVFDAQLHTTIPTTEAAGIVVRRLVDQKSNLFLLHNKKTLCQTSQLPSKLDNRLV